MNPENARMSLRNYTFREAGKLDFQEIEELFVRRGVKRGWTAWKYLKSPDGLARVFVAEDSGKTIVGTLAHLPRRFTSADTGTLIVLQAVDVFVSEELRTQGDLRRQVSTQLSSVQSVLEGLLVDRPRRRIIRSPK